MFYVSEIQTDKPSEYKTVLQELTYKILNELGIPFERVDTDEAISMADCVLINQKLNMEMVKTLFLCNRQQTQFYLYITKADKPFNAKELSTKLGIARLSFASVDLLYQMLGTEVGAATIFGVMLDKQNFVQVLIDKDVAAKEWYGCSDGTTTGFLKIPTKSIIEDFLWYVNHPALTI